MDIIDFIYNNFKFLEDNYTFSNERNNDSIVYTNRFCVIKFLNNSYEFTLEIMFKYKEYPEIYLVDLLNFLEEKRLPITFQSVSIDIIKKLLLDIKSMLLSNFNILIGKYDKQIDKYIKLYENKFNLNCDISLRHTASVFFQQGNYKEAYKIYCQMEELSEIDKKKKNYSKKQSGI